MLAFAEKELGAKWPELLDQIGGNGVALAVNFYVDPAPALLVLSGKDEKQVEKAYALAMRVVEEELARQGAKEKPTREIVAGFEVTHIGNDIHAAQLGATVLVSNKAETLKAAIEQATRGPVQAADPPGPTRRREGASEETRWRGSGSTSPP